MNITTGRKVRADAKLEQLNAAQRERLHVWLEENYTYREVVDLVRTEFGVSVGKSAVSAYYRRHVLSVQQEDDADVVAALAAMPAGDFDKATLQRVKVLLWLAVARPDPDVDQAAKLMTIIDKAERRALAVERVALKEREVVVREKLAGLRTTKNTKRHERGGESAVVGRGECPEVAARAQRGERLSKDSEIVANDLPRFPGYSGAVRGG